MKCRKAYGIMPVGENDRSAHVAQQKAPEVATPGLFYSVLGGWLNPKAGYPDGKKADCIRDTGLSKPTVYKWWSVGEAL